MPNPVLDRKRSERGDQIAFVDELLAKVAADGGRDLVDAELSNLTSAKERIAELDKQIAPLEEHEAIRSAHEAAAASFTRTPERPRDAVPLGGRDRPVPWSTAGGYLVDHLRARGYMADGRGGRLPADPDAAARINYALQNQITTDIPGILPEPIVGSVINLIDASRPFITSIGGARAMGGIPGKTFSRPKVTQHTLVGPQTAEKAELPSRKLVIGDVPFNKVTKGGALDVSRQSIDWSSPAAWDILLRDLADSYAIDTENEAADAFAAGADDVNAATAVDAAGDLNAWATAMYTAAGKVYASAKRLPNMMWISTDLWGTLGPLLDTACCPQSMGGTSVTSFDGNLFRVPRVVVPSFPTGTAIIGWTGAFEVYEEVIGLLTAVEPSLLGVEIAYGGYLAFNYVAAEGVAPITPPVTVP